MQALPVARPASESGRYGERKGMKRKFLVDTDTASDDAVALIMALRSPEVEVVGITAVAGNVEVRQASRTRFGVSHSGGHLLPRRGRLCQLARALKRRRWLCSLDAFPVVHSYCVRVLRTMAR
jgi:hypothetical protein